MKHDIEVTVDLANPGQFFACGGLLELADRLWGEVEGWFDDDHFRIRLPAPPAAGDALASLVETVAGTRLHALDPNDDTASPMQLDPPFGLRLDWWKDTRSGGRDLKGWAGRMSSERISRGLHRCLTAALPLGPRMFDFACVVPDPDEPDKKSKKTEPFYFDARRGAAAMPLDIGFSPDALSLQTHAFPVVEFLCFVGLQRFRPAPTAIPRVFEYEAWDQPLPLAVAAAAACGALQLPQARRFRFENAFRTDQKKHKAFNPAMPIERRER